jgi:dTDP-4-amino-4,6-dideoxygalactose transaminase
MTQHSQIIPPPLAFIDLQAQRRRIGAQIDAAIARVLEHGQFIMGPEVYLLEGDLAHFCGAKHAISCANGTDALGLVLMAKGVKPGDAILCPSFTFASTAEVVAWVGATPVFVDVRPDTFSMDAASLEKGIATAKRLGLSSVGVIPVDMFGQPADYDAIEPICAKHGLWILCDAAQSFGAQYKGRAVGTIGMATATSFYPAKPLGCYGDGGAIFTDDAGLAETIRSLRVHGQGADKYHNVQIGINGRLDTIQAAVLIEKLKILASEIKQRDQVAGRYDVMLKGLVDVPAVVDGALSAWAQYTIKVPTDTRTALAGALRAKGIPTAIYYPRPLHQQIAYRHYPMADNGLPVSETITTLVISLPMHPYLEASEQERIVMAVRGALA